MWEEPAAGPIWWLCPLCGAGRGSVKKVGEAGAPGVRVPLWGAGSCVSFQPHRVGGRARGPRALCAVFILMATLIPLVRMRLRELQSPVPGHTASQRQRWDEPPLGCPGLCPTPAWGTASLNQDSPPSGALGRSCWLVSDVGASFTLSLLICYIQVQRLHQGLPQRAAGCCRLPENL